MTLLDTGNSITEECVHESCVCVVQNAAGTEGYCSELCKAADESEQEVNCACGHPGCDTP